MEHDKYMGFKKENKAVNYPKMTVF